MASEINVHCEFELKKLSAMLSDRIAGQTISENIFIDQLSLEADDQWMYAIMKLSGKREMTIVAKFKLRTRDDSPDFFVEQLKIRVRNAGLLATGANLIVKFFLEEAIETRVQEKIHDVLRTLIEEMNAQYAEMRLDEGLVVRSNLTDYNFDEISWDAETLRCKLVTHGVIRVELK